MTVSAGSVWPINNDYFNTNEPVIPDAASIPANDETANVIVYIHVNNRTVYSRKFNNPLKARNFAETVIQKGYTYSDGVNLIVFPPHRILQLEIRNGADDTMENDNLSQYFGE